MLPNHLILFNSQKPRTYMRQQNQFTVALHYLTV